MSELGENLRAARIAAGLSLAELARRTHYSKSLVGHLETGARNVKPEHVSAYSRALDVAEDQLYDTAGAAVRLDAVTSDPCAPSDADYLASLRARIRTLIDLDFQIGGDQSSQIALRLFRAVHRKIGSVPCVPGIERELHATAGELAEVTGWFLYDAGKHDLARTINQEALHLHRLAGDHSTELLTLQNMSLHAGDRGRPVEALSIARMVLETSRLSPRVQALFRTREARALALLGDGSGAERTFSHARSLYLEGVRDDDPAWAWWINDQELAWHEAMIKADTGNWDGAVRALEESIEHIPTRETRRRYNHLANLLHTQVRAGAWREADQTITVVTPFIDNVRSTRSANALFAALTKLDSTNPRPARENAKHLRGVLSDAGYRTAAK